MHGAIHPSFSPRFHIGAPPVTGDEPEPYFAGYLGQNSVVAGNPLDVHVATRSSAPAYADVYRVAGCAGPGFEPSLELVERLGPITPLRYPGSASPRPMAPGECDTAGCGWPAIRLLEHVPEAWTSGIYLVQFTAGASRMRPGRLGEDAVLIVRPPVPRSRGLVQVGIATWAAYHVWGNRSLYGGLDAEGRWHGNLRASRVSMARPGIGLGPFNQTTYAPPKSSYLWKFLQWAEEEGLSFDYCGGTDIATGRIDLSPYRLLLTIGHDEYWSSEQRDRVEEFADRGGSTAFFGGNLAYWQVRLEDQGRTVVCHKRGPSALPSVTTDGEPLDPTYRDPRLHPGHDNSKVTVEFDAAPVSRCTTSLTGVSMRNDEPWRRRDGDRAELLFCGATWWWEDLGGPSRPRVGFRVDCPDHWAFEGLDLAPGDEFGADQSLVGFECDGLDVHWDDEGRCRPTGRGGALPETTVLAHADCRSWSERDHSTTPPRTVPGCRANQGSMSGVVTMVDCPTRGGGHVFTAPSTDWVFALVPTLSYTDYRRERPPVNPPSEAVRTVTRNAIRQLTHGGRPRLLAGGGKRRSKEVGDGG